MAPRSWRHSAPGPSHREPPPDARDSISAPRAMHAAIAPRTVVRPEVLHASRAARAASHDIGHGGRWCDVDEGDYAIVGDCEIAGFRIWGNNHIFRVSSLGILSSLYKVKGCEKMGQVLWAIAQRGVAPEMSGENRRDPKTINTTRDESRRPLSAAPLTRGVGSKTGNMPTHVSTPHTPPSASPSTPCAPFLAGHPMRRARCFFTHARRDR